LAGFVLFQFRSIVDFQFVSNVSTMLMDLDVAVCHCSQIELSSDEQAGHGLELTVSPVNLLLHIQIA